MDASSSSSKSKGPVVDFGLCRCCKSIKKCRLLTYEYQYQGTKEVYSDMIMDCFGLLLSQLDGPDAACVCAVCVRRLRDARDFKLQVLACEQTMLETRLREDVSDSKLSVQVKVEPGDSDHHSGDDVDINDSEVKSEPIESRRVRARRHERSHSPARQKKDKLAKHRDITHELQVYSNAVTLVTHSYVCPFLSRVSHYYCYYCKDQFLNPCELRAHTHTHSPDTFADMMENKKIPKVDVTRVDCRLCPQKIDTIDQLKQHLITQHNISLYPVNNEFLKFRLTLNNLSCTECGQEFPYFDNLTKHMIDHFGTHTCDICGACFLENTSLRTHIKSHSKIETNYPCEVCGKNLKSKYSRYLHVTTVHEKKPTVHCYKCDACFLSYALRNRHLIEVHGDKRTFPCKLCDKVYNRRKTLMEHHRRLHLKVYKHQCDMCDQRFYLPSRLKEHMATHTGERNFRCDLCEKSYPRLQSLQEHVRSHSHERRYKCELCHSAFTQNGSLKSHMKSHHDPFAHGTG